MQSYHSARSSFLGASQRSLILAERAVPRYTSYPTAPHFVRDVDADAYARWLASLPPASRLSLYLHVPFCAQMCLYCGCHTKIVRRREPVDAYAERLKAELRLVAGRTVARRVTHIHWGGGTPSILGPDRLSSLIEAMHDAFDLSCLAEHALELDPRHVDRSLTRALAAAGINRVSLGVQDFAPQVQEAIGRVQPFDLVAGAADALRAAGIDRINFDLMYGLPRQTVDDVKRSAELAWALRPLRIALFGYAHVPWFKTHQRLIDEATLPGASERLAQSEAARAAFIGFGYVPIGLDHFARADDELAQAAAANRLHRNFQGYTDDDADALIGLGASAIGRLPQGYVQNAPDIAGYQRATDGGRFATVKGLALTDDDRVRGAIIERLMCDLRVDLDAVASEAGLGDGSAFAREIEALVPLVEDGLARIETHVVTVTERGRPFVRLVAATFDAYLRKAAARHSIAV